MSNIQSEQGPEHENEDLAEVTALLAKTDCTRGFMALLRSTRGSGTIEKVFMIALFIFVAAVGLQKLGQMTSSALSSQASQISSYGKKKVN